jgi:hypothetical protein
MRKHIDDLLPRELANMVKLDSNDMEERIGIDLIKLIEEGHILVVGVVDGQVLYQAAYSNEEASILPA